VDDVDAPPVTTTAPPALVTPLPADTDRAPAEPLLDDPELTST
jgi:hypothetical protein